MGRLDYHKYRCREQTSYRIVIGKIISFAENEILTLCPEKSYIERLIIAQTEPFWTAARECRDLRNDELEQVTASLSGAK